jgi:predicted transcriptional regulator
MEEIQTTIRLNQITKEQLDSFKQYKNESYDELVRKLIHLARMCEKEPKLSQKTLLDIKEARERIKNGEFYTEEEAKKILGF